jgi:hypothetical protein
MLRVHLNKEFNSKLMDLYFSQNIEKSLHYDNQIIKQLRTFSYLRPLLFVTKQLLYSTQLQEPYKGKIFNIRWSELFFGFLTYSIFPVNETK